MMMMKKYALCLQLSMKVHNIKLHVRPPSVSRAAVCCRRATEQNSLRLLPFQQSKAFNQYCELISETNTNNSIRKFVYKLSSATRIKAIFKLNTKSCIKFILYCHGCQGHDLVLRCINYLHNFVFRLEMALITEICCY